MRILVPAFMISELKRAFAIGFLLFLPFLIIDLVVASVLMSMGMMMLPPVVVSLPFKLIFFVLAMAGRWLPARSPKAYGTVAIVLVMHGHSHRKDGVASLADDLRII